jgi:hypothetical protein
MLDHSESSLRLTCACGGVVLCRPDSDAPTRCAFCQAALRTKGESPADSAGHGDSVSAQATESTVPVRRRVFVAEIGCLLCGREAGVAVSQHWPPAGPILLQAPGAQTTTLVRAGWRLRCGVCGGNTAANEVRTRTVRLEPAIDWREVRPRRGRPPKWLVEQRRAAAITD